MLLRLYATSVQHFYCENIFLINISSFLLYTEKSGGYIHKLTLKIVDIYCNYTVIQL